MWGDVLRIAVYPGSFDPITNGHLDIIARSAGLFDQLIVAVLQNPNKRPLFSVDERMHLIREATNHHGNVVVDSFIGLLVDFARIRKACAVVRGLREITDFENELRMAQMNQRLNDEVVTVFIPTSPNFSYLSSSLIKDVAFNGGSISAFVPESVEKAMDAKLRNV